MSSRDPAPVDDAVRKTLSAAVSYLNRVVLTLVLAGGYVCVTAATVRDEVLLLPGRRLSLPVFNTPVEVRPFLLLAPALIVVLHGYLLAERGRLVARLHDLWPAGLPKREERRLYIPLSLFRDGQGMWPLRWLRPSSLVLATVILLPPALLLYLQFSFLPLRDDKVADWLRICVLADLVLLFIHLCGSARFALGGRLSRVFVLTWGSVAYEGGGPRYHRVVVWVVRFGLLLLLLVLVRMAVVEYAALPDPGAETPATIGSRHRLDLAEWKPEAPEALSLADRDLRYADFSGAQLDGADFRGADLSFAQFTGASLEGARFGAFEGKPSRMEASVFDGASLRGADFTHALLRHASFRGSDLTAATFAGADLRWARLDDALLPLAVLTRSMLERVEAPRIDLFAADLGDAFLTGANLEHGDLRLAELTRARVRGLRLYGADGGAVVFPAEGDGMDLRNAGVQRSVTPALVWLDLRNARLADADLRASDLVAHVDLRQIDYLTPLREDCLESRLAYLAGLSPPGVSKQAYGERLDAARERWKAASGRGLALPEVNENLHLVLGDRAPGENTSVVRGQQAAFRSEWAREMARLSCRNAYLAEAFVRRAAGAYRPRDPQLERELAAALAKRWGSPDCAPMDDVNAVEWQVFCATWNGSLDLDERCRQVDAVVAERTVIRREPSSPPALAGERPPPCPPGP
jgi:uncharacterized protein YjbI with pentapeptide repeats